jgi:ATP-dependent Clp protease ATP-binding subunit ClpC
MPAHRYPILILRDAAGFHTAVSVEDQSIAAFAPTAAEARHQVRDYLDRLFRESPWRRSPDFHDPHLAIHRVDVRAEYVDDERSYPCAETIALRVPVATGRTRAGLRVASIPTLGVHFSFYADEDLKPLITQYVQQKFKGRSPADVARYLCPADVELDDVVIQAPRNPRDRRGDEPDHPHLSAVANPLGSRELRGRFSRAWERDDIVARLIDALRKETAPLLLVGESGVGKSSILADAARRLDREGAPLASAANATDESSEEPGRRTHRFWLTSAPRLIAGMQYLGMWQERLEHVISDVGAIPAVLCAENLLDLVRTGGHSPNDSLGAFLIPYLQRAELRLIAEATPAELDAVRRLLPGLADVFQIIPVPAFTRPQAIACLGHVSAAHRQNFKLEVERGVVDTVYRLFARFMPYHAFPGKAAAFLSELFDRAARDGSDRVTPGDAITHFVRQTGVPELFLRDEWPLDPADVVATLRRDVIGQPRACETAAGVVTTFKAGLNDPARPLGVLLFTGPTGVGKTQLAQSLARYLFGGSTGDDDAPAHADRKPDRLIRLDMSEYAGPGAADRFLGSPEAGPAEWIQKVRQQPFTVVLLDEIEKAAPEIFDILLGVFDEGRLTDPWGRLTHFRSAVIVMTSNLGAAVSTPFGLSRGSAAAPAYESEAMGFFRPEFFNRIDAVVIFDPLTPPIIRAIAEKELADLSRREGLTQRNLRLEWTDRLLDHLTATGFDPRYGARPLQRAIESTVVTPLARYLVDHPGARGTLRLDLEDGHLTINE